ncbi:MAG: superoxide dismutase family protein [Acidobacteria bacterium]|nr:superoxide dismutase family protein [Acidobacteriota bacterium]
MASCGGQRDGLPTHRGLAAPGHAGHNHDERRRGLPACPTAAMRYVCRSPFLRSPRSGVQFPCVLPFTSAGGHFDPGPFGNPDPDANHPFHMGDLPNLKAGNGGTATLKARTTRVTLSDGPLSVFDPDGTALIVHANPDQEITGEPRSGVAGGPRVACGVLIRR